MTKEESFRRPRRLVAFLVLVIVVMAAGLGGALADRYLGASVLGSYLPAGANSSSSEKVKVVSEDSVVIDVVKKLSPSVVTVSVVEPPQVGMMQINPMDPFGFFGGQQVVPNSNSQPSQPQNIGTGFVIAPDGLIVTNKHVVSQTGVSYQVITSDDKKYQVTKIYRDPANDIAILKIDATGLTPVTMGDSSNLQVGQMVVAIGTALGQFRNTVTSGVISGLGRGIQAGDPYQGYVERLDNVIQTDAAINPGNSGGPLANSSGQVIGIDVAVAQNGQNIGFAIPINVVKESINNFNQTGQFTRPFLGVRYTVIDLNTALLNNVPQGAYVQDVVNGSPAEKAGIQAGDIITKIDGTRVNSGNGELSKIIASKKVGQEVTIDLWRNGKAMTVKATMAQAQ